jgi:hypothetical protein
MRKKNYKAFHFINMIAEALLLRSFPNLQDGNLKRFLTILYTTHWQIWLSCWRLAISQQLFKPINIINNTIMLQDLKIYRDKRHVHYNERKRATTRAHCTNIYNIYYYAKLSSSKPSSKSFL